MTKSNFITSAVIAIFAVSCAASCAFGQWVQDSALVDGEYDCFLNTPTGLFCGFPGGIIFSKENGIHWTPANTGLPSDFGITCLAQFDTTLFAGGGEYGVFRSMDAGKNWSPADSGVGNPYVYAFATIDTIIFCSSDGGVLRSTNNGSSWISANSGIDGNTVYSFTTLGGVIYAGSSAGTGVVYLSYDTGASWQSISAGLGGDKFDALAVEDTILYAGSVGDGRTAPCGVFMSTNGGLNWTARGLVDTGILAITLYGTNLFAVTSYGIFLSKDNGANWIPYNSGLTNLGVLALTISGGYMVAGTNGSGVWRRPLSDLNQSTVSENNQTMESLPKSFPNPFSQSTTINFSSTGNGTSQITILNLLGHQIAKLLDGELDSGEHSFVWDAMDMPPGTYYCVIHMNGSMQQVPMVLAR